MSTQLLTYIVLSSGLAIGIFIAFMAYANVKGRQTGMQRLRNLVEADEDGGAVLPSPHMSIGNFADTWQAGGLSLALKQADLDISKAAFMRIGLLGMAGGFALAYALLGGIMTSVFAGLVIFLLYIRWLFARRDKLLVEYEEGLADAAASMAVGAQLGGGTAHGAISNAALYAPPLVVE